MSKSAEKAANHRNTRRRKLKEECIDKVMAAARPFMIRRGQESVDAWGEPIVKLPPVVHYNVPVFMSEKEESLKADFKDTLKATSSENFQIKMRQFSMEPTFVAKRWYDPTRLPSSSKMRALLGVCAKWRCDNCIEEDQHNETIPSFEKRLKPIQDQTKLIMHTLWTSSLQVQLSRLYQHGFPKLVATSLIDTIRYTPTDFANNYDKIAGARERRGKRFALMSELDKPFNVATGSVGHDNRKKRGYADDRRIRAHTFVSRCDENQTLWIRPVGTTASKLLTTDTLRTMLEV